MRRSFRRYDDDQAVRIDARIPSPEKAQGFRRIHRDTDGTVIGAVTPDGTPLGSRAAGRGPVDGSRLGNPSTPGLDRNAEMNARTEAAPAGSQLLKDRQALHEEMKLAGRSGLTPEMAARAAQLGVKPGSFRRVADALPQEGVNKAQELAVKPVPNPQRISSVPSLPVPSPAASEFQNLTTPPAAIPAPTSDATQPGLPQRRGSSFRRI